MFMEERPPSSSTTSEEDEEEELAHWVLEPPPEPSNPRTSPVVEVVSNDKLFYFFKNGINIFKGMTI